MSYLQTSLRRLTGPTSVSTGGGPMIYGGKQEMSARESAFQQRAIAEELDPMLAVYRRGREAYASMLGEQLARPERERQAFMGSARGALSGQFAEQAFQAEQLRRYPTMYSTATDRQRASYKAAGIDDTRLYQPRTSGY